MEVGARVVSGGKMLGRPGRLESEITSFLVKYTAHDSFLCCQNETAASDLFTIAALLALRFRNRLSRKMERVGKVVVISSLSLLSLAIHTLPPGISISVLSCCGHYGRLGLFFSCFFLPPVAAQNVKVGGLLGAAGGNICWPQLDQKLLRAQAIDELLATTAHKGFVTS